jgi:hypothetical protein
MIQTGAETDILTGLPKQIADEDREAAEHGKEEARLKRQAEFLGTIESDAGRLLIEQIRRRLELRLDVLLKTDPEARALIDILQDLGFRENAAKAALDKLQRGYLRR